MLPCTPHAKQVSNALKRAGIGLGDRVATLGWNGARHLEAWYGIVGIGAICHTLNPRLFPEQIAYIANHAQDRMVLADPSCALLLEILLPQCPSIECVIFLTDREGMPATDYPAIAYDEWIAGESSDCVWGGFDENTACGLCYTSGTTGNPKGVLYAHRSNYLHALTTLQRDALALSARDTILLIVPMYHANAWGVVYSAPSGGCKAGSSRTAARRRLGLRTDGVRTGHLFFRRSDRLADAPAAHEIDRREIFHAEAHHCRRFGLFAFHDRTFEDEYGVEVMQGWGMTETSPLATVSTPDAEIAALDREAQQVNKLKQGRACLRSRTQTHRRQGQPAST